MYFIQNYYNYYMKEDIDQFPWDIYQLTSTQTRHTLFTLHRSHSYSTRLQHPHLPSQSSVGNGHAPREEEEDFNPEGNTITAFPPFFTSREPDPDPFVAGGKNKLKPTQPSPYLIPYLLHFRPSVQTGREKQAAVLLVVEIDDLCISLARNFLRIAEDPFSIQNEILYFIESS